MRINYNDYELLYLVERGCDEAIDLLILKYELMIMEHVKSMHNFGNSFEDILQDARMVIYNAITTYDVNRNVLFHTYLSVILRRNANRMWRDYYKDIEVFKGSVEQQRIKDAFMENLYQSESDLIRMQRNAQYNVLLEKLKVFDRQVLNEVLIKKMSKEDFAKKYGTDIKRVYNTIHKIKTIFSKIISKDY